VSIDPHHDHRRPYVGQTVLFHPRLGELGFIGREGCVPAQVLSVVDDDHVDLNLALAGVNPVVRLNVPRKTDDEPSGSWAWNDHDAEHYRGADELQQLRAEYRSEIRELLPQLDALKTNANVTV
jgi:hypothetical protein